MSANCSIVEELHKDQSEVIGMLLVSVHNFYAYLEKQQYLSEMATYWAGSVVKMYDDLEDWRQSVVNLVENRHNKVLFQFFFSSLTKVL